MKRCIEEVRALAPGDVDGFKAMSDVVRRLRDALRPSGAADFWIGDAPTREQIEERLGTDIEARSLLFDCRWRSLWSAISATSGCKWRTLGRA